MNTEERLKEIEEQLKKSASKIFKKKEEEIEKELQKETTLGSPKNLVEPDDKNES